MDDQLRSRAFEWLQTQYAIHGGVIPRSVLEQGFVVGQQRITMVGPSGIWKPKAFVNIPLSITTTSEGPYDDTFTPDGLLLYKYRGTDPNHRDNVGLREAMRTQTPLIYFQGIMPGRYVPVWPVFILEDHPEDLSFHVTIDPAYALGNNYNQGLPETTEEKSVIEIRRYVATFTKRRLHQTSFREHVVAAYSGTCTICRLRHRELLDAAHIIPDAQPGGEPIVSNGLCMCKIHHAAFDQNIIGISPNYIAHVRPDVLEEEDGPMLRHGLQGIHRQEITVPGRRSDLPDRDRLAQRFDNFQKSVLPN